MKASRKNHPLAWFINRIGNDIFKHNINIFNQPIKIESRQHATALYISQTKGYFYNQIKKS